MKNKIIHLRVILTIEIFKKHIRRFFIRIGNTTQSRYISIQTILNYKDKKVLNSFELGDRFIIDMESVDEKRFYNDYIVNIFQKSNIFQDPKLIKSINFVYIETDQSDYDIFVKNIARSIYNKNYNNKNPVIKINDVL